MTANDGDLNRSMQHLHSALEKEVLKMKQRPRIFHTATDKALMWDRWQQGESLHSIARLIGRQHSAIHGYK
jgi:hypothetical protein